MAHGLVVSWGRSSVIEWRRLTGEAGSQSQSVAKPSMKRDRDEQSMTGVPMKTEPGSSSLLLPLAACVVIAVVALAVPAIVGKTTIWIFLPGFFTESILLICSLALIAWVSKCNFAAFGFTRGTFRLSARIFLWLLPMAAISTVQLIGSPAGVGTNGPGMGGKRQRHGENRAWALGNPQDLHHRPPLCREVGNARATTDLDANDSIRSSHPNAPIGGQKNGLEYDFVNPASAHSGT